MTTFYKFIGTLSILVFSISASAQLATSRTFSEQVFVDSVKNRSVIQKTTTSSKNQPSLLKKENTNLKITESQQDTTQFIYDKINGVNSKDIKVILSEDDSNESQNIQFQIEASGKYWKTKH